MSLIARAHDSTTIHLSWTPPEDPNGIVIKYRVQLMEVNTGQTFLMYAHSTRMEITTVHPAYTYECAVAASTVVGYGPFSAAFNITTPEDGKYMYVNEFIVYLFVIIITTVPSGPPQNVVIYNVTARSVMISYNPPLAYEQNGIITKYMIELTNLDLGLKSQYEASDLKLLIEDLRPYTVYEITIAGRTVIGYGPFGEEKTFRTLESGK